MLREARTSVACVVFRDELYVVGGFARRVSASVEKLTILGRWTSVAPMPLGRFQCGAVVFNKKLCAVHASPSASIFARLTTGHKQLRKTHTHSSIECLGPA